MTLVSSMVYLARCCFFVLSLIQVFYNADGKSMRRRLSRSSRLSIPDYCLLEPDRAREDYSYDASDCMIYRTVRRWYFDLDTDQCQTFSWTNCVKIRSSNTDSSSSDSDGSNRFRSKGQCERICKDRNRRNKATRRCPLVKCPNLGCKWGYDRDSIGCRICQCRPDPVNPTNQRPAIPFKIVETPPLQPTTKETPPSVIETVRFQATTVKTPTIKTATMTNVITNSFENGKHKDSLNEMSRNGVSTKLPLKNKSKSNRKSTTTDSEYMKTIENMKSLTETSAYPSTKLSTSTPSSTLDYVVNQKYSDPRFIENSKPRGNQIDNYNAIGKYASEKWPPKTDLNQENGVNNYVYTTRNYNYFSNDNWIEGYKSMLEDTTKSNAEDADKTPISHFDVIVDRKDSRMPKINLPKENSGKNNADFDAKSDAESDSDFEDWFSRPNRDQDSVDRKNPYRHIDADSVDNMPRPMAIPTNPQIPPKNAALEFVPPIGMESYYEDIYNEVHCKEMKSCNLVCPNGEYVKDWRTGCNKCHCLESPVVPIFDDSNLIICSLIVQCGLTCERGYRKDQQGCDMCECSDSSVVENTSSTTITTTSVSTMSSTNFEAVTKSEFVQNLTISTTETPEFSSTNTTVIIEPAQNRSDRLPKASDSHNNSSRFGKKRQDLARRRNKKLQKSHSARSKSADSISGREFKNKEGVSREGTGNPSTARNQESSLLIVSNGGSTTIEDEAMANDQQTLYDYFEGEDSHLNPNEIYDNKEYYDNEYMGPDDTEYNGHNDNDSNIINNADDGRNKNHVDDSENSNENNNNGVNNSENISNVGINTLIDNDHKSAEIEKVENADTNRVGIADTDTEKHSQKDDRVDQPKSAQWDWEDEYGDKPELIGELEPAHWSGIYNYNPDYERTWNRPTIPESSPEKTSEILKQESEHQHKESSVQVHEEETESLKSSNLPKKTENDVDENPDIQENYENKFDKKMAEISNSDIEYSVDTEDRKIHEVPSQQDFKESNTLEGEMSSSISVAVAEPESNVESESDDNMTDKVDVYTPVTMETIIHLPDIEIDTITNIEDGIEDYNISSTDIFNEVDSADAISNGSTKEATAVFTTAVTAIGDVMIANNVTTTAPPVTVCPPPENCERLCSGGKFDWLVDSRGCGRCSCADGRREGIEIYRGEEEHTRKDEHTVKKEKSNKVLEEETNERQRGKVHEIVAKQRAVDCSLKHFEGPCKAQIVRFHYDPITKSCRTFNYGGCRGNANNFVTIEACMKYCQPEIDKDRSSNRTWYKTILGYF